MTAFAAVEIRSRAELTFVGIAVTILAFAVGKAVLRHIFTADMALPASNGLVLAG
jgi:hypothetical protein